MSLGVQKEKVACKPENCTNNGVESQNESLKYFYLQRYKNPSLTEMVTILVEDFFGDKFQRLVYNLNN